MDPSQRQIRSGLSADADIHVNTFENVIKIPSQAVFDVKVEDLPKEIRDDPAIDRTRTYALVVYRFVDGKAVATPVKIGASDLTDTIIESGISETDQVIVGPFKVLSELKHDQRVRLEEEEPEGESVSETDATPEAAAE
jgi:hypothetical protein